MHCRQHLILLKATRSSEKRLDQVDELLSKLYSAFKRMTIYLDTPVWEFMRATFVDVVVLLFDCVSLLTSLMSRGIRGEVPVPIMGDSGFSSLLSKGRIKASLFGNPEMESALERLKDLTSEESLMATAMTMFTVASGMLSLNTNVLAISLECVTSQVFPLYS